ncbi:glycosyltransferase [Limibaculum sp. M0105]|uniref:Glycosyltransferase n=1 Tax=Thermohalobaculum xanthum TaxID=2753746 RepID=A0A8J7SF62_9RHOB|nr:glycosyltransferase [Thermohalobaculum xanthum]MBK0401072.1 glycosyltransferase [Thermohalobaculum xanthum]
MISLYTPILPQRTGTADYANLMLRDLARAGVPRTRVRVVVDSGRIDMTTATVPGGYDVISYRALPNVVAPGDTAIFFIANNEHHGYIHAALRDLTVLPGGRVIAVVHEPCCAMLLDSLAFHYQHGFTLESLKASLAAQYGAMTPVFLSQFRDGYLSDIFHFTSHALGHVLTKAHEVWTHSLYAALKLTLESTLAPENLPRFRLVAHPDYDPLAPPRPAHSATPVTRRTPDAAPAEPHFVVGVFGWVSRPKRVIQAIRGFHRFLTRLDPDELDAIEMRVVGALPDPRSYDPRGAAAELGLGDRIVFHDFVDSETFRQLQATSSIQLNLRYPSCGETSGTLKGASQSAVPSIVTDYQAFREVEADEAISFLPGREEDEIADALHRQYLRWSGRAAPQPRERVVPAPTRQRLDRLIAGIAGAGDTGETRLDTGVAQGTDDRGRKIARA